MGGLLGTFGSLVTRGFEYQVGKRMLSRFDRAAKTCGQTNRQTLLDILARNAGTERGVEGKFSQILRSSDPERAYRREVPLTTWDDYVLPVERMAHGFQNVLCVDPIHNFALSSGTTGKPKMVPVTTRQHRDMVMHMACLIPTVAERALTESGAHATRTDARDINLMSLSGTDARTDGGTPLGSGSGSGIRGVKPFIPYLWCSPAEVFSLSDARAASYLHALFGLRERHVRSVQAVFAPHVLEWLRGIELYFPSLLRDIADGKISTAIDLAPSMRMSLEAELRADPLRAKELEHAAQFGFQDIVCKLWPELGYVATCVSGSFAQYYDLLRHYTGEVPIFSPVYGASESMIGAGLWLEHTNRYVLCVGASHFEFIPVREADTAAPQTLLPQELIEGESYEVVLTNRAGLYRYRLGDVIRCVGRYHAAPVMEFEYRRGTQLDLVGEKTTEAQTRVAVRSFASDWLDRTVVDYTLRANVEASPPRYVLYVEFAGLSQRISAEELDRGARLLDQALCTANPRYQAYARAKHRVAAPELVVVQPGGFAALERALAARTHGQNRNQIKVPRLLKDASLTSVLELHTLAHVQPRPSAFPKA